RGPDDRTNACRSGPPPAGSSMKRLWILALCLGLGACVTPGQAPPPPPVTEAEMRATVGVLASDAFEGRMAGTEGETKAAAYIAERFRAGGLTAPEGGYLQGFQVN